MTGRPNNPLQLAVTAHAGARVDSRTSFSVKFRRRMDERSCHQEYSPAAVKPVQRTALQRNR